jgi:predicted ester cyclase
MAGNRPNYEEALRAMFRDDVDRFETLVKRWPRDVRDYALERARAAAHAEREGADPASVVTALHERVWSHGEYAAIPGLVAPEYVIHSDPGDAWEGRRLDHAAYRERVAYSRAAFPDLVFRVDDVVGNGERVAVRWHAGGTHAGDLPGLPATGRRLRFHGQTLYEIREARVAGHWQVVDRLGFLEQVRSAPGPQAR